MITLIGIGILGFLLLVAQQIVYRRLWLKNLNVDICFSTDHIFEGEMGELRETIENRKRLPLAMLKVKFMTDRHLVFGNAKGSRTTDNYYRNDVFCIGGGERIIRTLKFQGSKRGYYTIKELSLVASDLFFMSQMNSELTVQNDASHYNKVPRYTEIYVYPKPYDSNELRRALIYLNGDMITKRHLLENPFEYRGIREYQPYDDMRSINWKATAKTGDLKVNQRHYTALKNARIFFDIQLNPKPYDAEHYNDPDERLRYDTVWDREAVAEMVLRITAAVCAYFLKQGMQVSCFGNGVDVLTREAVEIPSKGGSRHMDYIYRSLARVDVEQPGVPFSHRFEDAVFEKSEDALNCFVSSDQGDEFAELLTRYQSTGSPFVWFYPVQRGKALPKLPPAVAGHVSVLYLDT